MHGIYSVATGPMFIASFTFFVFGVLYKILNILITAKRNEPFIFEYINVKHSFFSILHWILPFASTNWRKNPLLTIITFSFHICCMLTPIFLLSHVVLIEEFTSLRWQTFPMIISDIMTLIVLVCLAFFFIRRILCRQVKFITTISDYVILLLVAIPFFTGFVAYHQWFNYNAFICIHIISAEILLVLIPSTRLSHIFLFFLSRVYTGSEFGKVRNTKDW